MWDDLGYWGAFFAHTDPKQILTVSHYDDEEDYENNLVFFENLLDAGGIPVGVFDWRFRLVESAQESIEKPAETPSNQGKTCSKNCVSCKDKETPVLEDKDKNTWFERGELPPIGSVCEHEPSGFSNEWFSVEVLAHKEFKGHDTGLLVVFATEDDVSFSSGECFRPIKTAEEIEAELLAEEREKAINEMESAVKGYGSWEICADLYDAGYRLVGEDK